MPCLYFISILKVSELGVKTNLMDFASSWSKVFHRYTVSH